MFLSVQKLDNLKSAQRANVGGVWVCVPSEKEWKFGKNSKISETLRPAEHLRVQE